MGKSENWGMEEVGWGEAIAISQESLGMNHCSCPQNSSVLHEQEWVSFFEGNASCGIEIGEHWAIDWLGWEGFEWVMASRVT